MGASLWLTVSGASRRLLLAWIAALGLVALVAPTAVDYLGLAGAVLVVLGAGWLAARRLPDPLAALRRFHLDDLEVTEMGPGRRVRRLPWAAVETIVQEPGAVALHGAGAVLRIPIIPLVERGVWTSLLARVVPGLADDLWALLEEGERVRLVPQAAPSTSALAWWAYAPALVVAALGAGPGGLFVAAGVALGERLVAGLRAHRGTVTLQRAGIGVTRGVRAHFIPWPRVTVSFGTDSVAIAEGDGPAMLVASSLPNFWAAAPVIELRAHLGAASGATVHFRVRVAEGRLAVVGEVEPTA